MIADDHLALCMLYRLVKILVRQVNAQGELIAAIEAIMIEDHPELGPLIGATAPEPTTPAPPTRDERLRRGIAELEAMFGDEPPSSSH